VVVTGRGRHRRPARLESAEQLLVRGRLRLDLVGPDGLVRERREGSNVMCTGGFTQLAAALVWSGLTDQAANVGAAGPVYLAPLYGAIGTGAGVPAKADTGLFTEYARQAVGAGASTPATSSIAAQATWLFYFASPASTVTITEAGLFVGATSQAGSGTLVDHWAFSPTLTVPTTDSVILQVSLGIGP
jgi:hypothetical protein